MHVRRLSPTSRQESEMADKNLRELQSGRITDPVEKLRLLCLTRGAHGILGLGRLFRLMHDDGDKIINLHEFTKGLRKMELDISDEEIEEMFEKFDTNGTGRINVDEFLINIRPPLPESRMHVLEAAFNKVDKNGDGEITIKDLKHAYNVNSQPKYVAGEESEDYIVKKFLGNFDQDALRDGKLSKEEFFSYYAAISSSIDNDCYFDLIIRQAYKL